MSLRRLSAPFLLAAASLLLAPAALAQATDPLPGVNVNLGQGLSDITLTGVTGPDGKVTFAGVPGATYTVSADTSHIAGATIATLSAPGVPAVVSAPLEPLPASQSSGRAKTSNRGYAVSNGGDALTFVLPPTPTGRTLPAGRQQSVPVTVTITRAASPPPANRLPPAVIEPATRQIPATRAKPPG